MAQGRLKTISTDAACMHVTISVSIIGSFLCWQACKLSGLHARFSDHSSVIDRYDVNNIHSCNELNIMTVPDTVYMQSGL
jgi:hypothetical protein